MPVPIVPSDFKSLVPSYSGPECETLKKLLVEFPTDFYLNYSAIFNEDGTLTDTFSTEVCAAIKNCPALNATSTTSGGGGGGAPVCVWALTFTSSQDPLITRYIGHQFPAGTTFDPSVEGFLGYVLPSAAVDGQVINPTLRIAGINYSFTFTASCTAGDSGSPTPPSTVTLWRLSFSNYAPAVPLYGYLAAPGNAASLPLLGVPPIAVPATGAIGQIFVTHVNIQGINYEFDFTGE